MRDQLSGIATGKFAYMLYVSSMVLTLYNLRTGDSDINMCTNCNCGDNVTTTFLKAGGSNPSLRTNKTFC